MNKLSVGSCRRWSNLELWAPGLPGVRVWFLNTSSEYWRKPFVFLLVSNESINWVAKDTGLIKCGQQHAWGVCETKKQRQMPLHRNAKLPISHTRTFFVTKNRRPPEHRTRLVCLGVSPSPLCALPVGMFYLLQLYLLTYRRPPHWMFKPKMALGPVLLQIASDWC